MDVTDGKARLRFLFRIGLLTILGIGITAGLYYVWLNPPTDETYYPKCTLHSATGLHCPGCGLTRSVYSCLHGEFEQAVAYNLLAPILLPLLFFGFIRGIWSAIIPATTLTPRKRLSRMRRWFPAILAVLLIVFGVLRNIPVYPLTLLAPHQLSP